MLKKIGFVLIGIIFSILFLYLNLAYSNIYYQKLLFSTISIIIIYFILKIMLEYLITPTIKIPKSKYSFRKIISIFYYTLIIIILTYIWIEDAQSLLLAYGIIAAGFALAMQDVFRNFVGGIIIFINKPFKVGDRIELNSNFGDVLDIGIMYTTLLEIKGWVNGDQATGRIIKIPNSFVLANPTNNYTEDHEFIWDEITLPITYNSDWKNAQKRILNIIINETKDIIEKSNREITKLEEKYYLDKRPTEPNIFLTLTDNWVTLNIRYVTETRKRRLIHNKLSQLILDEIQKSKKIKIASQTLAIVEMPKQKN